MAVTVQIVSIRLDAPTPAKTLALGKGAAVSEPSRVLIQFADGTELEFADVESARAWAAEAESVSTAQRLAVNTAFTASADLTSVQGVLGKSQTLDLSAASIFRVV